MFAIKNLLFGLGVAAGVTSLLMLVLVTRLMADEDGGSNPSSFAAWIADYECDLNHSCLGFFGPINGECGVDAAGNATGTCFYCDNPTATGPVCIRSVGDHCQTVSGTTYCGSKTLSTCRVDSRGRPYCKKSPYVTGSCNITKCQ